jgi:hypothetical protein
MVLIPFHIRSLHDHMGNAPELMSARERVKVSEGVFKRASGDCVCEDCGKLYYDHPPVIGALWLTRLCNNHFVKL